MYNLRLTIWKRTFVTFFDGILKKVDNKKCSIDLQHPKSSYQSLLNKNKTNSSPNNTIIRLCVVATLHRLWFMGIINFVEMEGKYNFYRYIGSLYSTLKVVW